MRFFDSWWEHVPAIVRYAPLIVAAVALTIGHPLKPQDYYWE
jgi:hypothetical protein